MIEQRMSSKSSPFRSYPLLTLAALFIVIAGLRQAQSIVLPVMLAVFISILSAPLLFWLRRQKIPNGASLLIILSLISLFGFFVAYVIGTAAGDFSSNLPFYEAKLKDMAGLFQGQIGPFKFDLQRVQLREAVDPAKVIQYVSTGFNQISDFLTQSLLILILVAFILLETTSLYSKLQMIVDGSASKLAPLREFVLKVNRYMLLKTVISFITGFIITVGLMLTGLHYPILWGFLAFLLNFIPNVGSIIAGIPAIILALIQFGVPKAVLVAIIYLLTNFVIGNMIEPKFMGRGLGLSPLFVFASLIFWGWMFGPVGMLLAIPLTMVVKIGLDSYQPTRWIGIMLGPDV